MTDLQHLFGMTWMAALGQHLARVLTPLLPADRELVATGLELAVMVRREGTPLRVGTTMQLPTPGSASVLDAAAVDEVLRDVQDEIAIYLARAWPDPVAGRALHPAARSSCEVIALSFEPRSGDATESVVLEPFVPPPPPDEARVAG
ncbi:hypothetical protein [Actinomycetospora flava]|uniref:Uncharacterized protein n=1 Tax=Actinomycetospora flava TaxID=3129232 RepID=A0ABU8MFJ5_9PSEU